LYLSACDNPASGEVKPAGRLRTAKSFVEAGAESLVMSFVAGWSDVSTRDLMIKLLQKI